MTGSSILILFFFSVLGLISSFGKNSFLTGSSLVMGLLELPPLMTGVLGPLESVEFGLVLSSLPLLSNAGLSLRARSLVLRCWLFPKRPMRLIL